MRAGNGTRGLHPASIVVASSWFMRAGKGTCGLHPASDRRHCLSLCTRDTIPRCSTPRGSFRIAIGSRRISAVSSSQSGSRLTVGIQIRRREARELLLGVVLSDRGFLLRRLAASSNSGSAKRKLSILSNGGFFHFAQQNVIDEHHLDMSFTHTRDFWKPDPNINKIFPELGEHLLLSFVCCQLSSQLVSQPCAQLFADSLL
ncbi:hypothetical protein F2Q69_00037359 [Brassica cretica]|uniref:Uncharacterized protein n=1 Tax=Brassica cretica TaxID=69181 RepID=A0A8S9SSX8_BRACR|nr:hypothetical protein F2Q69_00037359 [Brassica cretica]